MADPNSEPTNLTVPESAEGQRLDAFLAEALPDISRSRLKDWVAAGRVTVNGHAAKPSVRLQGGEEVGVEPLPRAIALPEPEDIPLDILYEDDDVLVINKPAGMVVHPGAGVHTGTLVHAVLHHCPSLSSAGGETRPGIVHRLDRLTSGCLVVAKNDAAHLCLSEQLADRSMSRVYLAWVVGRPDEIEGVVDAPIARALHDRTRMSIQPRHGRRAVTHWRVVAWAPGLTRVQCRLETGRTHQIRVHLAHIGHPVVGDPEYGYSSREARLRIPPGHPTIIQALSHCRRQLLHAFRIRFNHPRTGEPLEFEAPLPEDFRAFDAALRPYWEKPQRTDD